MRNSQVVTQPRICLGRTIATNTCMLNMHLSTADKHQGPSLELNRGYGSLTEERRETEEMFQDVTEDVIFIRFWTLYNKSADGNIRNLEQEN